MDQIPAAETNGNGNVATLYMSMELSSASWVLAFSMGGVKHRRVTVPSGDQEGTLGAIEKSKRHLGLKAEARVVSCYEAGRDGFWIHRWLASERVENVVVDSSSIEVDRRARRAKTDRLDAEKLLDLLVRHDRDERHRVLRVVRVPSAEQEDARRLHREIERLKKERTGHTNRIRGLLVTLGIRLKPGVEFPSELEKARQWDGSPVPDGMREELTREHARRQLLEEQIFELDRRRSMRVKRPADLAEQKASKLVRLKGIGAIGGWTLSKEMFGWRTFRNRREVGAAAGLTGTPFASGSIRRDQGIAKSGNARIRSLMVELSWRWLTWQPNSQLSQWFHERFGAGGKRHRRVGIVALARKLLIALWRFVEQDVVPEGAIVAK